MRNLTSFSMVLFTVLLAAVLLAGHSTLQPCYAQECYWCESDFNKDGDVDGNDLSLFSYEYGSTDCCTGISDDAIYVSISNPAAADIPQAGITPSLPALSISFGISQALDTGRSEVRVASGVYVENIVLPDGIRLLGGYNPINWQRDWGAYVTAIKGSQSSGYRTTIEARNITRGSQTILEGFVIFGENAGGIGENSYAIWVKDSADNLVIRNNVIWAGSGGNGSKAYNGANGEDGAQGADGVDSLDLFTAYGITDHNCTSGYHSPGGSGGANICGGISTDGGNGGNRVCPAWNIADETTEPPVASENGQSGLNAGGSGGVAGWDVYHQSFSCLGYTVYGSTTGENGQDGPVGINGAGGSGCTEPGGFVSNNHWIANSASAGGNGSAGGGGGGGGSSAGAWMHESCFSKGFEYDNMGGTGGGGGAGGCGAHGGTAGSGGGGSFGLFVVFSTQPGTIPEISDNIIHTGDGGKGGDGGSGGIGGLGSGGGSGGAGSTDPNVFPIDPAYPSFAGGHGGNGGNGGHGGGGGGGCGGISYGIYSYGQGTADLSAWASQNTFHLDGSGGNGGLGGGLIGNLGNSGQTGESGAANF